MTRKDPAAPEIVWHEVYWADILDGDEKTLCERLKYPRGLRNLAAMFAGDVIGYSGEKYKRIQDRFKDVLSQVKTPSKVILVGHSLGTVIMTDAIYNHRFMLKTFPDEYKLDGVVTAGSPIALYSLRYGPDQFQAPIQPRKWINIRYPRDLIGYPLRPLNKAYGLAVHEDLVRWPSGSNILKTMLRRSLCCLPLVSAACHTWYFDDPRVVKRIAALMAFGE